MRTPSTNDTQTVAPAGGKRRASGAATLSLLLAAATFALPLVSRAEVLQQEGCIEWSRNQGCIVRQICTLDTGTRHWVCVDWDSRNGSIQQSEGYY